MKKNTHQFTSESVSAGHPDKIADQISDAILDAYLAKDPHAKVAIECLITTQRLLIAGEVTSPEKVNAIEIAKHVLDQIGYNDISVGFDWKNAQIEDVIHQQSPFHTCIHRLTHQAPYHIHHHHQHPKQHHLGTASLQSQGKH